MSTLLAADKFDMFRNRLVKVYKHKAKQAKRLGVTCWRVYDHDLPEFPLAVDVYEQFVHLSVYLRRHGMTDDEHEAWLEQAVQVICTVIGVANEDVFIKERRRKANRHSQYQKTGMEGDFLLAEEAGLKFYINLTDYLDTGLFIDHRITRQMVQAQCAGKRVLNLFCYTGAFSVYAAAGEAAQVTSVDLSKTYLHWAEKNMQLNKLHGVHTQFVHADCKQYLKTLVPNSYDLVVMDPPTFSNSKRMKDFLDIQADHVTLLNDVLHALTPEGIIYFSTNYTKFQLNNNAIKASNIKDITKATTPFDFEGKLKRWCYLITK